jgi:hypothetical protein
MRFTPELLIRVMAQMDSDDQNVRIVAMEKARTMLAGGHVTFAMLGQYSMDRLREEKDAGDLHGQIESGRTIRTRSTGSFTRSTPDKPYVHPRVAGRFARSHKGKPVIRGTIPPKGSYGRLRVLSDVEDDAGFGYRKLRLSLDANEAIYEPFVVIDKNEEVLSTIRNASISGSPFEIK